MKGEKVEIDTQDQAILKPLRDFWNNPNLDANEKFLRDYVLNDKVDSAAQDADLEYNHYVIHDSDENLSEDEKTIEKQEEFERKYNYRFEEPDQEYIKRCATHYFIIILIFIRFCYFYCLSIIRETCQGIRERWKIRCARRTHVELRKERKSNRERKTRKRRRERN